MELDKDFKEFLFLLNKHKVEYLVVGGYAVTFHGYPRYTGDLDVWVNKTSENGLNLINAIQEFGYETDELQQKDFENQILSFYLGVSPIQLNIVNQISGVKFKDCFDNKNQLEIEKIKINYISKTDLIKNKKASGRHRDLDDVENLE